MRLANSNGTGDGWLYMPDKQPRVCTLCGGRITLAGEPIWFKTCKPLTSWHFRCKMESLRMEDE